MFKKVNDNYTWNVKKLKTILYNLENKKRTKEEEMEYQYLLLLFNDSKINYTQTCSSFLERLNRDNLLLTQDYSSYIPDILDFFKKEYEVFPTDNLKKINLSKSYMFESVHDFFKNLDSEWFLYFLKIYKERKDYFSFSTNRSSSILLRSSDIWLANITVSGTIADVFDMTHEYGHGIIDQITTFDLKNPHRSILVELFPILVSILYLSEFRDKKYINEADACFINYHYVMLNYIFEISTKYKILNLYPNIEHASDIQARAIDFWIKENIENEILELYSTNVGESICYAYPYIIATKLFDLYYQDKDLFIHKVKSIFSSTDNCIDIVKKLDLK